MKNIFTFLFFFTPLLLNAQPGSVELKTGAGNLIAAYSSVTDAYAAIPSTISNAYVIELTSGYNGSTEIYPIVFSVRSGSSSTNTITLRPAAGVASISITANKSGGNILNIDDADYI